MHIFLQPHCHFRSGSRSPIFSLYEWRCNSHTRAIHLYLFCRGELGALGLHHTSVVPAAALVVGVRAPPPTLFIIAWQPWQPWQAAWQPWTRPGSCRSSKWCTECALTSSMSSFGNMEASVVTVHIGILHTQKWLCCYDQCPNKLACTVPSNFCPKLVEMWSPPF